MIATAVSPNIFSGRVVATTSLMSLYLNGIIGQDDVIDAQSLTQLPGYAEATPETMDSILEEAGKYAVACASQASRA